MSRTIKEKLEGTALSRYKAFFNRRHIPEWKYLFPIVLLSLAARIVYFLRYFLSEQGLPVAYDTEWYLRYAREFINTFNIELSMDGIFYSGYYTVLALMLAIFKINEAVVAFQMLLNALTVIFVYKLSQVVFNRRTAILAGVIYALNLQVIKWSIFIITDSFFITTLVICAYCAVMLHNSDKPRYKYGFAASAAYMVILRPTGMVSLTFILAYIMINLNGDTIRELIRKPRIYYIGTGFAVIAAAVAAIIASGVMKPLFISLEQYLVYLIKESYINGRIFDIETPYDYRYTADMSINYFNSFAISYFVNNWDHVLVIYAKRLVSFLGVWVWKIGEADLLTRFEYLVPMSGALIMAGLGLAEIFRNRIFKAASIVVLLILSIQVFCLIFFMDSAFRYRVPGLVFIGILGAYGMDRAICLAAHTADRLKHRGG